MTFQVEMTDVAEAEIESAFLRLNGWKPDVAKRWLEGLLRAIDGLSLFPTRPVVVQTSETPTREIRRMLYRHGRTTYLVLFCLVDSDGDEEEDTVRVLHVRHGARKPLGTEDTEE